MSSRLLIIRHGQTDWNAAGKFQGQTDVLLNAIGQEQAEAVARRICRLVLRDPADQSTGAASPHEIAAIYASDLQRAWKTAKTIHAAMPDRDRVPLVAEPRLREMSFGDWEGLTYSEIRRRFPTELSRWEADLEHTPPPNGEAFQTFAARVEGAYAHILEAHPSQTVVLVAHGGPLQTLIAQAVGLSPDCFWKLHLSNASLSEVRIYPEGAILNLLNDCSHLASA